MKWYIKKIEQGKVSNKSVPLLSGWERFLLELFSLVVRSDGIDILATKTLFISLNIPVDNVDFFDTIRVLSRLYRYSTKE